MIKNLSNYLLFVRSGTEKCHSGSIKNSPAPWLRLRIFLDHPKAHCIHYACTGVTRDLDAEVKFGRFFAREIWKLSWHTDGISFLKIILPTNNTILPPRPKVSSDRGSGAGPKLSGSNSDSCSVSAAKQITRCLQG